MQKLVWQNANGVELDLTSGNYGITEWEGFSNASLNIQSQQVPFQDGGVFLDALIEQRELSVTLAMQDNNNLELRYQQRRELISALNPKLGEGYLIYTNDFISKRIKCVPQIPLFETHNSDTVGTPKASLSWTACEPYWEDVEETTVILNNGIRKVIENEGDVSTQIRINMYSEGCLNPNIQNLTTSKEIKYNGSLAKDIQIDTSLGNKKIENVNTEWFLSNISMNFYKVRYYNNNFIYVGANGMIITSTDGIHLSAQESNTSVILRNICFSESLGLYLIVGDSGTILTSPNLKTWTVQTSGVSVNLSECIFSKTEEMFIVLGANGTLLTSTDGTTWVSQTTISNNSTMTSLVYGNGKYIASGTNASSSSVIYKSTDGLSWSIVNSGGNAIAELFYCNEMELFVGVGNNKVVYSTDGETWSNGIIHSSGGVQLHDIIFVPSLHKFIACGIQTFYYSINGVDWYSDGQYYSYRYSLAVALEKGIAVTCGQNGRISFTIDFENWENPISDVSNASLNKKNRIKYFDNINYFINSTGGNVTEVSQEGDKWVESYNYPDIFGGQGFNDVIYEKNIFVIATVRGGVSSVFTSTDAINWDYKYNSSSIASLNSVAYSEEADIFVVVGSNGTVLTTTDFETWTVQTSGISENLLSVVYIKVYDLFIAVGTNGTIITSQDGITWTVRTSGVSEDLNRIANSENKAVIVGNNGTILTTQNGIRFNVIATNMTNNLQGVCYSKKQGKFVIVGYGGKCLISSDGNEWVENSLNQNLKLDDVVYSELLNKYVITGQYIIFTTQINTSGNLINYISSTSDMTLNLEIKENELLLTSEEGNVNATISYRQKYIGV